MRTTKHSGRFKRSTAKHNDRRFDLDENPYIDQSRTNGNRYWTWCDGLWGSTSFEDAELKFYQENFKDLIEDRNERAAKQSHPERKTSASKLIHSVKTMPEEEIFEIGNKDNHVTSDQLWSAFVDYFSWHNREYGEHVKILDIALHTDQATPNIHMRKVWMYDDAKGFKAIGQHKALQQLGYYDLPDPSKKIGKYNNLKMRYTDDCRKEWLSICKKHGIDIEEVPEKRPVNEQNLTRQQYIMRDQDRIIEEHKEEEKQLEGKISESQDELESAKSENKDLKDENANLEKVVIPQNQKKADKIISDANDQAGAIRSSAWDQANNLVSKAEEEIEQLNEKLPDLRTEEKTLEGNIKTLKGDIKGLEQRKKDLGTEIQGKLDKAESEAFETLQKASEQADKIIGEAYQVKYHTVQYPNLAAANYAINTGEVNGSDVYVIYPDSARKCPIPIFEDEYRQGKYVKNNITEDVESGKAMVCADVPEDKVIVPKTVCKEIVGCLDRMSSLPASVKTFTEEFKASDPDRNRKDNSWSEPTSHGAR